VRIAEIFHSIQGEGMYIGVPQVFVRFAGCDVKCAYCDTVTDAWEEMTPDEVLYRIRNIDHRFHSVALTGGEPLAQSDALAIIAGALKDEGRLVFLETNGTMPEAFDAVSALIDIVSMDIKLPSVARVKPFWDEHRRFLKAAKDHDVFGKAVVSSQMEEADLIQAAQLVAGVDRAIPLYLQPLYGDAGMTLETIRWMYDTCTQYLNDVRCVAQMHKYMAIP